MERPLSETTPIKVGFVIGLLGLLSLSIGGAIWWAAVVSTKLDSVLIQFKSLNEADRASSAQIEMLRERLRQIELVGSPKAVDIEHRLNALEKAVEMKINRP
jgi:hypothetical protein